jgi:hypothetical protein
MSDNITEEYLLDLVNGLVPDKALFAGKHFLKLHLKEKGVDATIEFVNKILDILDDEEGLNKELDFTEDELAILKRASFNGMTTRNFLRVWAWAACGIPIAAYGAGRTVLNSAECLGIVEPEKEAVQATNPLGEVVHFVGKYIMPPAEIVCGAALTYEAIDKHNILKLEQVSRAVTRFADKIAERYPDSISFP